MVEVEKRAMMRDDAAKFVIVVQKTNSRAGLFVFFEQFVRLIIPQLYCHFLRGLLLAALPG